MKMRRCQPNITVALGIAVSALAVPGLASAEESAPAHDTKARTVDLEAQGVVVREMIPTSFLGFDAALVLSGETFSLRAGGALLGAPSFRLASNEVTNMLTYGLADACVGKSASVHRIRFCVGGEAGGWVHRWRGYGQADRRGSHHIAGTVKGDYRYALSPHFGLLFGVGVKVLAVGPQFRGHDEDGRPTPVLTPGPVAGSVRIGMSVRFR